MATGGPSSALQQLIKDDAVRQLRQQQGLMATLGSEDGALKLDWVEGVQRLLADNAMLEQVEAEAREIWERGIRHIIWAGMGGSIMAVRVLTDLGFCSGRDKGQVTIYPLDSTYHMVISVDCRSLPHAPFGRCDKSAPYRRCDKSAPYRRRDKSAPYRRARAIASRAAPGLERVRPRPRHGAACRSPLRASGR